MLRCASSIFININVGSDSDVQMLADGRLKKASIVFGEDKKPVISKYPRIEPFGSNSINYTTRSFVVYPLKSRKG